MSELFLGDRIELRPGDCRDIIKAMPDNSIDSVVTDPPYALVSIVKRFGKMGPNDKKLTMGRVNPFQRTATGFMNQKWDNGETAFAPEFWAEVLRVLKPGGHVVAFSGTRTYHRMAVAIEDAGFEIRDSIYWHYGSGFPKSHSVPIEYEKTLCVNRDRDWFYLTDGERMVRNAPFRHPSANEWDGWGTALKPATEPICLARKPLIGTVAANVLAHGTGAINIDGCRAGTEGGTAGCDAGPSNGILGDGLNGAFGKPAPGLGRWPANLVHDGSDEVLAGFPETTSGSIAPHHQRTTTKTKNTYGDRAAPPEQTFGDSGSAARFFYTAKADKLDRMGSKHPTVKPVDLMQWLVRLVTPKGGVVLDPFAGSGSTGEAAYYEGMRCILCEREPEYQDSIRKRLSMVFASTDVRKAAVARPKPRDDGPDLFGGLL